MPVTRISSSIVIFIARTNYLLFQFRIDYITASTDDTPMISFDSSIKQELKQFAIIAIPLSAAYLAEFAMFVTSKMVVGKLGYHSLAAVGIASDLSFEILVVLMALLSIVGVLAAQAHGAGKKAEPLIVV